jgi:hypothetical protein
MLSIFWVCGPPGVGKSTAAWRLYTDARPIRTAVHLAGDDLLGLSPATARAVLDAAVDEDARFAIDPRADFVIDTSEQSVGETAEAILTAALGSPNW